MNFSIAHFSIVVLLFTLFSEDSTPSTLSPSIFAKTVEVREQCDQQMFDQTLEAYNEFYNHSCKHVKLKMGEVSKIEQKIVTGNKSGSLEVVYNETIKLENNTIELTSDIVELRFYKGRKSSYERVLPSEITVSSRKANAVEKHKKSIRRKSEELLSFLIKK